MDSLQETLKRQISSMLKGTDCHLIEIRISNTKRFIIIHIFLDREDGFFSHGDCVEWSSHIQDEIDAKNLVPGDYRLEISSPGIGRPLRERWEFKKNCEKRLIAEYLGGDETAHKFTGILTKVGDDGISLKSNKIVLQIPWNNLLKAKVLPPW